MEDHTKQDPAFRQFRCKVGKDEVEEILTYNEILDFLDDAEDGEEDVWRYQEIRGYDGPYTESDADWEGSPVNFLVKSSNGEVEWVPEKILGASDPVTLAMYIEGNKLWDLDPSLGRYKRFLKNKKKMMRMINQAKLKSYREAPRYKYGYEVPRDHAHAMELDRLAGNTKWRDSELIELGQIDEYGTFEDLGNGDRKPEGFKKINVHIVYDVKHDGRHKSRLVAGGHLTPVPLESVYSSVVSLRGVRLIAFLAELNQLDLWCTDIGNAYLESFTKEKVYIVAGPEFGDRKGHTLVIRKALYGLRTSGQCWHERLADVLRSENFVPSKAEPDIWMRDMKDHYEYIGVYVDDLIISSKNPQSVIDMLTTKHSFKLKGTGPISYHLGCDFYRDEDGTLCMAPRKYIERMVKGYEQMFGSKPKHNVTSPLEKGDHPELDSSDELDMEGIKKYQSLIGTLQWAISLGRFDVATAVMTMSSFRAAPRQGHLERVKRICGYLSKMKHGVIRFRTGEPDYSDLEEPPADWTYSVYGEVKEEVPKDAPTPRGKRVVFTSYVDANLYHCMATGRAVSGVLHFINQTPIDWYTKKQATVETATYGSEFVAARIAVDQIIDLRTTLRYLGVEVHGKTKLFGDNESVVTSSSVPHSVLKKRHVALCYHRVREAIASDMMGFYHIFGQENPADVLSKHWGYQQVWPVLRPILFWSGDTNAIPDEGKGSMKIPHRGDSTEEEMADDVSVGANAGSPSE